MNSTDVGKSFWNAGEGLEERLCSLPKETERREKPEEACRNRRLWKQPSGPRQIPDEVENECQRIVAIREENECLVVEVTLIVSGFIIGPEGISIRSIQSKTSTRICSRSEFSSVANGNMIRVFKIQGDAWGKLQALKIISAAIRRYKFLAEGSCSGSSAQQIQRLHSIDFYYCPPPKMAAPFAAGLKAFPGRYMTAFNME